MPDVSPRLPERLAQIRQLAEEHSSRLKQQSQQDCPHDQGVALFEYRFRNGARHTANGCLACQKPLSQWLKTPAESDTPVGADDRFENPPCVRCGDFGTEQHHFAPRALFGAAEAELWPTAWLCPGCHDYWHRVMAGATRQLTLHGASEL